MRAGGSLPIALFNDEIFKEGNLQGTHWKQTAVGKHKPSGPRADPMAMFNQLRP
ncbi:hypothetical protein ACLOJK_012036 [Asimina triloba]